MEVHTLHIRTAVFFDSLRHELKSRVTAKLGHIDEAIARALGHKTRASLLAALAKEGELRIVPNEAALIARLAEFGCAASPGLLEDAYMEVTTYDTDCFSCVVTWVRAEAEGDEDEDDWTPPWELDPDDELRISWEHALESRGWR